MAAARFAAVFVGFALCVWAVEALYLPGLVPVDYEEGAALDVLATKLTSNRNKVPYGYYSLPFCVPPDAKKTRSGNVKSRRVNLGQLLLGEHEYPTAYDMHMLLDQQCVRMCDANVSSGQLNKLRRRVLERYSVRLMLDTLPLLSQEVSAVRYQDVPRYVQGFRLGNLLPPLEPVQGPPKTVNTPEGPAIVRHGRITLNNHVIFTVLYNAPAFVATDDLALSAPRMYRIVGFKAEAMSIDYSRALLAEEQAGEDAVRTMCMNAEDSGASPAILELQLREPERITYTYSVKYEQSDITWATRWDAVMAVSRQQRRVQLLALGNSMLLGLLLTGALAIILLRTLRRDLQRYAEQGDGDDALLETGWKLVAGDVFRTPAQWPLLVLCCATGAQLCVMVVVTLILAALGFLSPVHRGALLTALVVFYPLTSVVAGFVTSRMVRLFGMSTWKGLALGASLAYPAVVVAVFLVTNLLLWSRGSVSTTPFVTVLLLLFIWLCVSCPLVFVGAKIGFSAKTLGTGGPPGGGTTGSGIGGVRVNQVPRQIPNWSPLVGAPLYLLAGAMPFGVVCVELLFVLNSIWQNEYYYMFGMLLLVWSILVVTAGETSIAIVYLKLIMEDYRWWWPAFLSSGSSGLLVFLYSLYYYASMKHEQFFFVSTVLYVGYMFVISLSFALAVGAIGVGASYVFVWKLYDAVRYD
mmetsp:Transcript_1917/g.4212  ORF Transcript_1917/g.4212 Transcript_1917/m.4212 type:complete len:693 (-) Transcript_1917:199-2277(-)